MHAERDNVLPILSACRSDCASSADIVSKRIDILSHFSESDMGIF